jgi:hypothetical protein
LFYNAFNISEYVLGRLVGDEFETIWKKVIVARLPSGRVAMSWSRFEKRSSQYPLNRSLGELQNQSGRFGEEINILSLLRIEP